MAPGRLASRYPSYLLSWNVPMSCGISASSYNQGLKKTSDELSGFRHGPGAEAPRGEACRARTQRHFRSDMLPDDNGMLEFSNTFFMFVEGLSHTTACSLRSGSVYVAPLVFVGDDSGDP